MSAYEFSRDKAGWSCMRDGRGVLGCRTRIGAWFSVWSDDDYHLPCAAGLIALLLVVTLFFITEVHWT